MAVAPAARERNRLPPPRRRLKVESVTVGLPQLNFIHDQNCRARWLTPTYLLRTEPLAAGGRSAMSAATRSPRRSMRRQHSNHRRLGQPPPSLDQAYNADDV